MMILWRRYARSGGAPVWLYAVMAVGFTGLAAWGAVRGDWLVAAIAAVMVPATYGAQRVMRRVRAGATAPSTNVPEADRLPGVTTGDHHG
jgi:hypothetical protein